MRSLLGRFHRPNARSQTERLFMLNNLGDGSTLSLDFTSMSSLDSRFTFTRSSTISTYINSSGLVTTAGTNVPRFDYDPTTLAPRGLLIESSAINLCLNGSMAFTSGQPTSYTRAFSQCTVASVSSTTFPGQLAWSISATAIGQRDFLEQIIALAANTTYTVSAYVEAITGTVATFAYMTLLPSGASSNTVVNPSAGRISFTVTVGATAGNGTLRIGIGTATGTGVSADASVRFSHVQVEAGSGASSYIPTGASTVQRAADSCSIALSTFGFNTAEGTFYVDFFRKNVSSGSGSAIATDYASTRWLGIDTASGSNTVNLNSWGGTTSSANGSTRNKVGASYGAWTGSAVPVSLCVNNTAAVTGNRDFNPSNATYLTIGAASSSAGTNPPYGVAGRDWLNNCVAAVKYWPIRLPNNTLRVITA